MALGKKFNFTSRFYKGCVALTYNFSPFDKFSPKKEKIVVATLVTTHI
jgi:hypothetical protein